ncbi:MAG TPA: hypothetical protein VMT67_09385 [Terriglobales bacterium]|nr:hypothetical protein [Terriglobales bacterium]
MAALKRCATQNQALRQSKSTAASPEINRCVTQNQPLRHPKSTAASPEINE